LFFVTLRTQPIFTSALPGWALLSPEEGFAGDFTV